MNQHLAPETLIDYLHGELTPADDAAVHVHLASCPACLAEYQAEVALTEALRTAAAAEAVEMPSLVNARVWETIRAARPSPVARLAAAFRPAFALPVAALLLVAGFFASPLSHAGGPRPTIDATYYFEQHAAQQAQYPLSEHSSPTQAVETSAFEGGTAPEIADTLEAGVAAGTVFDAAR